jgi:hypothetical protein
MPALEAVVRNVAAWRACSPAPWGRIRRALTIRGDDVPSTRSDISTTKKPIRVRASRLRRSTGKVKAEANAITPLTPAQYNNRHGPKNLALRVREPTPSAGRTKSENPGESYDHRCQIDRHKGSQDGVPGEIFILYALHDCGQMEADE